jgi:SAM-dependent methyltransferase
MLIPILIIILAFIVVVAFLVIIFGLNMVYINLKTLVPWVKTPLKNLQIVLEEIKLPAGSLIYDLGCGDGRFLFLAEKKGLRAIGYELALYPYLKAQFNKFLQASLVKIKRQDFLKQNLNDADAVFVFLNALVMGKIGLKLKEKLRPEIIVVSYGIAIPGWKPIKILQTKPSLTYIYKS